MGGESRRSHKGVAEVRVGKWRAVAKLGMGLSGHGNNRMSLVSRRPKKKKRGKKRREERERRIPRFGRGFSPFLVASRCSLLLADAPCAASNGGNFRSYFCIPFLPPKEGYKNPI